MIGGWPLFTQTLLTDLDPEEDEDRLGRRAAGGARVRREGDRAGAARAAGLPVGRRRRHTIVDKVHYKKDVPTIMPMELVRVTKENLGEWARQLKAVGLHRRARGVPEDEVGPRRSGRTTAASRTRPVGPLRRNISKRFPGVQALDRRRSRSPRVVPRALRRERRGQEHARQDPRRHLRARRRAALRRRAARCTSTSPRDALPPASAWCTRSSRSARTCRSPRISASARCRARRHSSTATRCGSAPRRCWPRSGATLDVRRLVGELTIAAAADGADRGGGRRRRAHHRLRRADEQPRPGRSGAAVRADRAAAGAGRDVHLRLASDAGDLPAVRHGDRAARRPARRHAADGGARPRRARADDDRPPARRVLPAHVEARRGRRAAARRGPRRARASSRTSRSRCARARWSASRASSAPAAPRSRRRCSGSTRRRTARRRGRRQPLGCASPAEAMRAGIGFVPGGSQATGARAVAERRCDNVTLPIAATRWRALGWHARRRGARAGRRVLSLACACARRASTCVDRRAVRRQPAEDRAREVARGALPRPDPR